VLRWIEVQPDDVGGLGLEVRIVGSDVALESMRPEAVLGPDARHRHVRDAATEFGSQLTRRPLRRAIGRLVFRSPRQHARLQPLGHLVALAAGMSCEQPGEPFGIEAFAPAADVAVGAVELAPDIGPGAALREQQHQTSAARRIGSTISRTGLTLQFHVFALGQFHHALPRRDSTTVLSVTVH